MKLTSWNINSVRLRAPLLAEVAKHIGSDVICLQETKTPDEHFPHDEIEAMGFKHRAFTGMKSYNGVAILSKYPLEDVRVEHRCENADCRHIAARVIKDGKEAFDLHNIYIPAGGYEPDPVKNDKFKHKLDFVDELTEWFPKHHNANDKLVVVGDLNIAPLENDVWDHKKMVKVVSHTPVEVEKFKAFQYSMGWVDSAREFVSPDEKLFTWWSYRAKDWAAADKGRRLDHIWVTAPLKSSLKSHHVLKDARGWERPSDHAPLTTEFDI